MTPRDEVVFALRARLGFDARHFNAGQMIERVCKAWGVTHDDVLTGSRVAHITQVRQALAYWLWEECNLTYKEIAVHIGVKDHTSAIYAARKARERAKTDFEFKSKMRQIKPLSW